MSEQTIAISQGKLIEITRTEPGHAHTKIWGKFSGPVSEHDIRDFVYPSYFGGRELRIDWFHKTFYGIRHDD